MKLVADIGGTHGRFALVNTAHWNDNQDIANPAVLKCKDYDGLEALLEASFAALGDIKPSEAILAVAGPVQGDHVKMTNLPWEFSISALQERFKLTRLDVINDLAGVAYCVPYLSTDQVCQVKAGTQVEKGRCAVISVGTGLGVAGLTYYDKEWIVRGSEAGHTSFSPTTELDLKLMEHIYKRFQPLSNEALLSGSGILLLYRALGEISGRTVEDLRPKNISEAAIAKSDALCLETMQLFWRLLATFAGDMALCFGATGGIYFAGDILRTTAILGREETFTENFCAKGAMKEFMDRIPVYFVDEKHPALLGLKALMVEQSTPHVSHLHLARF